MEDMMGIDQAILNFFTASRIDCLNYAMLAITYAGSTLIVMIVASLSIVSFYIHKHASRILPLIVAVCGSSLTTFLLKSIFERVRPLGGLYMESTYSFPSGHATAAMALYGFLLYTIYKHGHRPLKGFLIALLSVLILLIGLSRIYLGVHYLSDVLAGYAIGLAWILIGAKLHNRLLKFERFKEKLKNL